jgi:tetratricopeptide (TPR) repeat protein
MSGYDDRWMVRKADGNVYGPAPTEAIVEWVQHGKLERGDEIAAPGELWTAVGTLPEFERHFSPDPPPSVERLPSPVPEPPLRVAKPKKKKPELDEDDWEVSPIRVAIAALLIPAIAVFVWWAISIDLFVIDFGGDEPKVVADEVTPAEIPSPSFTEEPGVEFSLGARIVNELRGSHPKAAAGGADLLDVRGARALSPSDSAARIRAARTAAELGAAAHNEHPDAVATLAEVYALTAAKPDAGELERIDALMSHAEDLAGGPERLGSYRVAVLLYSGRTSQGIALATELVRKSPDDPKLHFLLGLEAAKEPENAPDARRSFAKALQLAPEFHRARYELALLERAAGEQSSALANLERKTKEDPDFAPAHAEHGALLEEIGDLTAAAPAYDRALSLMPMHVHAGLRRAALAYQLEGDAPRAARLLGHLMVSEEVLRETTMYRDVGVHLSAARRLAGNARTALKAADRVLASHSGDAAATFHRALALADLGRTDDAVAAFEQVSKDGLRPYEAARLHYQHALALQVLGRAGAATRHLEQARTAAPSYVPAWLALAAAAFDPENPEDSLNVLRGHLDHDPLDWLRVRDPDLFHAPAAASDGFLTALDAAASAPDASAQLSAAAAVAAFHSDRRDASRAHLHRALEIDDRAEAARFYAAVFAAEEGDHATALRHLQVLTAMVGGKGAYHLYLGEAFEAGDQGDKAVAAYEKSLGYGLATPYAQVRLASLLARRNQARRAVDLLEGAVQFDPSFPASRLRLFELSKGK